MQNLSAVISPLYLRLLRFLVVFISSAVFPLCYFFFFLLLFFAFSWVIEQVVELVVVLLFLLEYLPLDFLLLLLLL